MADCEPERRTQKETANPLTEAEIARVDIRARNDAAQASTAQPTQHASKDPSLEELDVSLLRTIAAEPERQHAVSLNTSLQSPAAQHSRAKDIITRIANWIARVLRSLDSRAFSKRKKNSVARPPQPQASAQTAKEQSTQPRSFLGELTFHRPLDSEEIPERLSEQIEKAFEPLPPDTPPVEARVKFEGDGDFGKKRRRPLVRL